jgi:hypothetical protein
LSVSYGPTIASLSRRLSYYERIVWLQIAVTVAMFALLYAIAGSVSLIAAVLVGVLGNVLTTIGANIVGTKLRR